MNTAIRYRKDQYRPPDPLSPGDRVQTNEQHGDQFGEVTHVNGTHAYVLWDGAAESARVAKNKIIVAPSEAEIARRAAKIKKRNMRAMRG